MWQRLLLLYFLLIIQTAAIADQVDLATVGGNHPSTDTDYSNLGSAWKSKGDYDKVIVFYD